MFASEKPSPEMEAKMAQWEENKRKSKEKIEARRAEVNAKKRTAIKNHKAVVSDFSKSGVKFFSFDLPLESRPRNRGMILDCETQMVCAYRIEQDSDKPLTRIKAGFAFCSPQDRYDKYEGMIKAIERLASEPVTFALSVKIDKRYLREFARMTCMSIGIDYGRDTKKIGWMQRLMCRNYTHHVPRRSGKTRRKDKPLPRNIPQRVPHV